MSRPTTTFSFKPRRWSRLPVTAASVSTRVVSWNDAAEMNDSVAKAALVMPFNTRSYVTSSLSSACNRSFSASTVVYSTSSPAMKSEPPGATTLALRSICRTMVSMCLSLMVTPCSRYTSWIS